MGDDKTDVVRQLFVQVVPEVASGIVEIRSIARKPGQLTKVALVSHRAEIDCIHACVGNRGAIITKIVNSLGGEPIDLIRWDDSTERLIANSLQPEAIENVTLNQPGKLALVKTKGRPSRISADRLALSQGLASQLCGWQIEIQAQ